MTAVDSPRNPAQRFHADLKAKSGAVVVVNSVAGFKATLGNPAYSASKAGLIGLMIAILLVIIAIGAGTILTAVLIHRYAGTVPLQAQPAHA